MQATSQQCPRCQGLMVADYLEGFDGTMPVERYLVYRCVNCGAHHEIRRCEHHTNPQ